MAPDSVVEGRVIPESQLPAASNREPETEGLENSLGQLPISVLYLALDIKLVLIVGKAKLVEYVLGGFA